MGKTEAARALADALETPLIRLQCYEATVTTEVQLSGKVATMSQGVLQDVSGRLVQTFAQNLATMLEGGETAAPEPTPEAAAPPAAPAPEPAEALDLGSLGGAVIAGRLRDPRALGGLLALTALIFYLLGGPLALRRRA